MCHIRRLPIVMGWTPMHCYRGNVVLAGSALLGPQFRTPHLLPRHFVVDERHTRLNGQRVYSATTIANGRVPGAAVKTSAAEENMEKA